TTEEYEEYLLSHSGSGGGMGIIVVPYENSGLLKIVQVYEGSPAEKAGLKKNDIIISSGEKQFSNMDYEESVAFLQGETGSVAELEILRLGETISFSVTRDIYDIKTVLAENFNGTGYIKIRQFIQGKTFDEFETAYSDLISQNIDSIIFDVRDNVGGELGTICDVLDLILPEGPIIRYEDTDGIYEQIDSDAECMQNIDAVVLINESTYSAAELFAAALNDYDVATLIGKTTYGKGMMQYTVPFTDGSALKLSISKFYPPYSENFEGVGVLPDIDVDMDYTDISSYYDINYENDTQLIYALNYLK
ncbi:MAG: PDZ domain-containing protein, partial [Clostridia bacterium]|nr:PDZ domain-containing protein [Clostridia bacterium]